MTLRVCLLVLLAVVTSAQAQEPTPADYATLQSCLEAARDAGVRGDQCIGTASDACMTEPDGQTTMGMVACAMREEAVWDEQLNFAYGELRDLLDKAAADELRDIQRLWIKWRDGACALPIALYQGGSAHRPAMAFCTMRETARRAIDLSAILDEFAGR